MDTVTLPRETAERVLDALRRVTSSTGHRLMVVDHEHRGHCPRTGGGHCTAGCVEHRELLHALMDALSAPVEFGRWRGRVPRRGSRQPALFEEEAV